MQVIAAYKPAYGYGGPTMSVARLSEMMITNGLQITVFTTTANGKKELPVNTGQTMLVDGVPVVYFNRITKDHTHFSPKLLIAVWKNVRSFDIIHIHAWWNLVSMLSCMIALVRGVPVIFSPRGTLSAYSFSNKNKGIKHFIHTFIGKPLLNRCHFHVTSAHEAAAVRNILTPKSLTIISNFVKIGEQGTKDTRQVNVPVKLLFFSRIERKKGLELLLDALPKVTLPFHLTIAGNGDPAYVQALKSMVTRNGMSDAVTWAGFVNTEKFDLIRQHDLLILPSYDENFANCVIESLSVGTPVLISENVGLSEYVKSKYLGWICKSDTLDISIYLNDILLTKNKELLRIKLTAPGIIQKDFSDRSLAQQYIQLYQTL